MADKYMPYGLRYNSNQPKAQGFLGEVPIPGGRDVATEYSVGVPINGRETQIPTLVPTLTKQELNMLVQLIRQGGASIPDSIMQKAAQHAEQRMQAGQSPFWRMPEKQAPRNGLLDMLDPSMGGLLDY